MDLLNKKRSRAKNTYTIPFQVKQNLTLRLLDDCFNENLILSSSAPSSLKANNNPSDSLNGLKQNNDVVSVLLNEIADIESELELFVMEGRKKKMVKLIEKMAEYIDESTIDIEELTDIMFLGKSGKEIEKDYLNSLNSHQNEEIENTNRMLQEDNNEDDDDNDNNDD